MTNNSSSVSKESHYILYYSVLNTSYPNLEISEIIEKSMHNNQRDNLTGALIYQDFKFMGYLEGDRNYLETTFKRISKDPRHQFLKILVSGKNKERHFDAWRTFWNPLTNQDLEDVRAINNDDEFDPELYLTSTKKSFIRELLISFYHNDGLDFQDFWSV